MHNEYVCPGGVMAGFAPCLCDAAGRDMVYPRATGEMHHMLGDALQEVQRGLPLTESSDLASCVHWTPSETFPVHRWFRYREGFSPYLFDYFPESHNRLDPFCGCGTTLLESARRGIRSAGVDLNPLATFVARTKTKRYTGADRMAFIRLSDDAARPHRNIPPAPLPEYGLIPKLFLPGSLDVLLRLKQYLQRVEPPKVRDLLLLAWLSILEDSSNVFKEGNGLKYRNKRRQPGEYATLPDEEWIPRRFGGSIPSFVLGLWKHKCAEIAEDIEGFRLAPGYTPRIRTGSCLDRAMLAFGAPFDLVVFSPPYANRFDYFEAFKMELWMGGFVKSGDDMRRLRAKSFRNNLAAPRHPSPERWPLLAPFLAAMDPSASSVRMGIKNALDGYFCDLRVLLRNLRNVTVAGAKVAIVVGNSAYAKSIVPTDALVARLGHEEGYRVSALRIARHLHVSSQQRSHLADLWPFMRESLVVLVKH